MRPGSPRPKGGSGRSYDADAGEAPGAGTAGDVTVLRSPAPADLVNLLADTIDEVKTGKVDPRVANAGRLSGRGHRARFSNTTR